MIYDQAATATNSPQILWDSVLTRATITANHEDADGPAVNVAYQATNRAWIYDHVDDAVLTITLSSAEMCNIVGFAAHTMIGLDVKVQYWTGAAWVNATSFVTPADNTPFMVRFGAQTATIWRVIVVGGAFHLGVVYLGAALSVPGVVQPPHTPLQLCETVEVGDGAQSISGQFLGADIAVYGGDATVSFEVQLPSFVLSDFAAFRSWFNRAGCFFIACAPDAWPDDMGYCRRSGDEIVPPFRDAMFMDLTMDVSVYRG